LFDAKDTARAAAGFHLALADALADWLIRAAQQRNIRAVCLGGGCFHNRILRTWMLTRLNQAGLQTFLPNAMGCGDAGLAIGQAWVAAQQLQATAIPDNTFTQEAVSCA
jgi:hydrogenase maturation protein HypF